jgi:hypothetical protein
MARSSAGANIRVRTLAGFLFLVMITFCVSLVTSDLCIVIFCVERKAPEEKGATLRWKRTKSGAAQGYGYFRFPLKADYWSTMAQWPAFENQSRPIDNDTNFQGQPVLIKSFLNAISKARNYDEVVSERDKIRAKCDELKSMLDELYVPPGHFFSNSISRRNTER